MSIEISALYSTYNRGDYLRLALNSLLEQTLPTSEFEVVIVDDGSTDHTKSVVDSFTNRLPINYVYQEHKGLAAGKNLAIKNASSSIVVFMDDDDIASPELLMEHLKENKYTSESTAILGYTDLIGSISADPLMHFATQVGCYLFSYPSIIPENIYDYTFFWGGRSSCKKSILLEHGLFDEDFIFGCEDIELGFRLSKKINFQVKYHPHAKSTMLRRISYDDFCNRAFKQGHSNALFLKKHPCLEIANWVQKPAYDAVWHSISDQVNLLRRVGERLDRIAQSRVEQSLEIDDTILYLLHKCYYNSFDASRMQGSAQLWEI